jgi:hypothetical protein
MAAKWDRIMKRREAERRQEENLILMLCPVLIAGKRSFFKNLKSR